jgi:TATA-binding protein-associated factor Taf7
MANYKTLNISGKKPENLNKTSKDDLDDDDLEIILEDEDFDPNLGLEEDDDLDDTDVRWEESSDEDEEEVEEVSEEEDEEETEEKDDEEEARGPRENDRIRTLIEERNREREEVLKERQERLKLQKQMNDLQKSTVATSISILKDNLKGIKKQMLQARESDNN